MYINKSTINFTNGKQFCGKTLDGIWIYNDKDVDLLFLFLDIKDLTPVRGQQGKISDTQGKYQYTDVYK
jgi:hypothetical protein